MNQLGVLAGLDTPFWMPQIQLPIIPASSTTITHELALEQRDGQVFYFNGHLPVFTHPSMILARSVFSPASSSPMAVLPKLKSRALLGCLWSL